MLSLKLNNRNRDLSIQARRQQRYRDEADPVYLKAVEDAVIHNAEPDLSEWIAIKAQIREELPYE